MDLEKDLEDIMEEAMSEAARAQGHGGSEDGGDIGAQALVDLALGFVPGGGGQNPEDNVDDSFARFHFMPHGGDLDAKRACYVPCMSRHVPWNEPWHMPSHGLACLMACHGVCHDSPPDLYWFLPALAGTCQSELIAMPW